MKLFSYFKYFFYIGLNWNFWLAFFTVYHEIKGEKKYGIKTLEINDLQELSIKGNNLRQAEVYQGANYFLLEKLFSYLQSMNANKNIVDFGSGKGRVLAVASFYGFEKITGIEFAAELCHIAQENILPVKLKFPQATFEIINADAVEYTIENDTNVFFFFNPFNEVIMLAVVKNILASLKKDSREIYVVYINSLHKKIFLSAGFEEIYHYQKLYYLQGSILKKSPEDFGAF